MNRIEVESASGWFDPYVLIKDDEDGESITVDVSDLRKFITDLEQIAKGYGV